MTVTMSVRRTCAAPSCVVQLDWDDGPVLCAEHYDAAIDAGVAGLEPLPQITGHVADEMGAAYLRQLYPRIGPRQAVVFMTYARTGNRVQAAYELGISTHTLSNHLRVAYRAMEVDGGIQAVYRAFGVEAQLAYRSKLRGQQLAAYLGETWLNDALRSAMETAIESMISAADRRVREMEPEG